MCLYTDHNGYTYSLPSFLWFTWHYSVNQEVNPNQANIKEFPGTDDLMSPLKDVEENQYLGQAECI